MLNRKTRVSTAENATNMAKLWAKIDSASFFCPAPIRMAMRMDPPRPTRVPKEVSRVTIGPHTPTPARAISPISSIFPINIRSIMLYKTVTNWAIMEEIASFRTRKGTLSFPKSVACFISFFLISSFFYKM